MRTELKALKDAWEKRPAAGPRSSSDDGKKLARDDDKARKLADKFVSSNSALYKGWEALPLEVLVKMVDKYRDDGDEDQQWQVEAWLLHHFEPQNIGGLAEAKIRVVG